MAGSVGMRLGILLLGVASAGPPLARSTSPYRYFRVGNPTASSAKPRPGLALMGGGADLDKAFRWLCARSGRGDFLVLRATGDDDYNPYVNGLCHLNSVATLIIPNREAAADPFVARTISQASALFISGGDQANYINFWMGTPVQAALNEAIKRGVPIGGTSAGLAVMGEYSYTAQGDKPQDPNLDSNTALANPFNPRATLVHGFLDIPVLQSVITDTHFARRDRMGRLLVFLALLREPRGQPAQGLGPRIRGIGVDERAAVLVESDGRSTVIGHGGAYFLEANGRVDQLVQPGKPLFLRIVSVQKVAPGHTFNLNAWAGDSTHYELSVTEGSILSSQPGGAIY